MFEGNQGDQLFAKIIIDVVKSKHQAYEREHRKLGTKRVPLESIHFWIVLNLTISDAELLTRLRYRIIHKHEKKG